MFRISLLYKPALSSSPKGALKVLPSAESGESGAPGPAASGSSGIGRMPPGGRPEPGGGRTGGGLAPPGGGRACRTPKSLSWINPYNPGAPQKMTRTGSQRIFVGDGKTVGQLAGLSL